MKACLAVAATTWRESAQDDVPIHTIENPVRRVADGDLPMPRHDLDDLAIEGLRLPALSVAIEDANAVSFDCRMGPHWRPHVLCAYFKFLNVLQAMAKNAKVDNAGDGNDGAGAMGEASSDREFGIHFEAFVRR